ncbi:MAG: DNA-binding transcriptional regulator Fis [Pseudomonadota bacterium]|nr:DNA-binding transcriptional regulator Fis [Pseudomonadota bacterium]
MQSTQDTIVLAISEQEARGLPLRKLIKAALDTYFEQLDGEDPANLYDMVLEEVERPLLKIVMAFTAGNQSKAATLLGMSRGTLRKKLAQYQLEE